MVQVPLGAPVLDVVGSINVDVVTRCPRLPSAGETVAGTAVTSFPGAGTTFRVYLPCRLPGPVVEAALDEVARNAGDVAGEIDPLHGALRARLAH